MAEEVSVRDAGTSVCYETTTTARRGGMARHDGAAWRGVTRRPAHLTVGLGRVQSSTSRADEGVRRHLGQEQRGGGQYGECHD